MKQLIEAQRLLCIAFSSITLKLVTYSKESLLTKMTQIDVKIGIFTIDTADEGDYTIKVKAREALNESINEDETFQLHIAERKLIPTVIADINYKIQDP